METHIVSGFHQMLERTHMASRLPIQVMPPGAVMVMIPLSALMFPTGIRMLALLQTISSTQD
jgi:hypothetical protein